MRIAAAHAHEASEAEAIDAAIAELCDQLDGSPDLLILGAACHHEMATFSARLDKRLPDTTTIGTTSYQGVMTDDGFHRRPSLALWGLRDPDGVYGSALVAIDDAPRQAAAHAVERAIEDAGRCGEMPSVIWLHCAPGQEERVIAGIEDVIGRQVPILGGSSADDDIAGRWQQMANHQSSSEGIAIAALYPSVEPVYSFHSGYEPTGHSATVTDCQGRIVWTLDERPAAEVYHEWTDGSAPTQADHDSDQFFQQSIFFPLGRRLHSQHNGASFLLSHPRRVVDGGGLELFNEVALGDDLILMTGDEDSLASRAGRVTSSALDIYGLSADDIAGGLVVFCAGCLSTITDRTDDIIDSLHQSLRHTPFMGLFTLGEQGCFIDGQNRHGNLMVSSLLFRRSPAD